MREYLIIALFISVPIIVMKWNLIDAKMHRWNLSDNKNRVGVALFSLVFLLFVALTMWR